MTLVCVQCVDADDLLLEGPSIPLSVARLELSRATPELLKHLIATRTTRALQSLRFRLIDSPETAALAAELVSTDPAKEWTFKCELGADAAPALCDAAAIRSGTRLSSLTDLDVINDGGEWQPFAALFFATPSFRRFAVRDSEVICDSCSLCFQTVAHLTPWVGRPKRKQSTARRFPSCLHRRCVEAAAFTRSTLGVVSQRTCI
jgi:hypothetical protein